VHLQGPPMAIYTTVSLGLQFLARTLLHTRQIISAMFSCNYIAASHSITHSPCTSTCTTHPALLTPLDGVKVLWCHFHLVWLVFRVPSLHALVFIQKTFLWLVLCIVSVHERWFSM